MKTRNQIAAAVEAETATRLTVELVKGEGYWYFTFTAKDDGKVVFYQTESVYTMRLSDMSEAAWLAEGRYYLAKAETAWAEMQERKAELLKMAKA